MKRLTQWIVLRRASSGVRHVLEYESGDRVNPKRVHASCGALLEGSVVRVVNGRVTCHECQAETGVGGVREGRVLHLVRGGAS